MQKIHYVTLLYAIKFHNVQRNVSKVNTFDEPYRNLEKSKRWHLYSWCLIQVDHMESPTRWPYGVSNKMSIWSLQQDDHMESPTRRPYGVSNKTIIWSIQQVDHMESPTRRPHWVSNKTTTFGLPQEGVSSTSALQGWWVFPNSQERGNRTECF